MLNRVEKGEKLLWEFLSIYSFLVLVVFGFYEVFV